MAPRLRCDGGRRSAVLTISRDDAAINDGTTAEPRRSWRCYCGTTAIMAVLLWNHGDHGGVTVEPRRSWRCHCGLCRTSTAVAPRLRCDGGRMSAVLTIFRDATAINDEGIWGNALNQRYGR